jgi:hypothetical protein
MIIPDEDPNQKPDQNRVIVGSGGEEITRVEGFWASALLVFLGLMIARGLFALAGDIVEAIR